MTDGQTYSFGYQYNLAGALVEQTYPSGRKVKNSFEADGDLAMVQTQKSGGNWETRVDSITYTSAGAVSSMRLGNNRWESTIFNSRLQPTQIGLGLSPQTQELLKLNYEYGGADNNGNIKTQTITAPNGFVASQTYEYDSLNRLKTAQEVSNNQLNWKQVFQYDFFGNRKFDASQTTTLGNCPVNVCNPDINPANNRVVGHQFDNAGNTTQDAQGKTFTYDALNKQVQVKDSNGTTLGQCFYDGDGRRVKKQGLTETTIFVYDAFGTLAAEYTLSNAPSAANPSTGYLTVDNLGSARITTDATGNVQSRRDFMPFGEELTGIGNRNQALGYQSDSIRQKFTGYEKDSETDLDFAQNRYYANKNGRFLTIDPLMASAKTWDPQSFNRYVYVGNNPTNIVDPLGLDKCDPKKEPCKVDSPNILKMPTTTKDADGFTVKIESVTLTGFKTDEVDTSLYERYVDGLKRGVNGAIKGAASGPQGAINAYGKALTMVALTLGLDPAGWKIPVPTDTSGSPDAPSSSPDAGGSGGNVARDVALAVAVALAQRFINELVNGKPVEDPYVYRFGRDRDQDMSPRFGDVNGLSATLEEPPQVKIGLSLTSQSYVQRGC